MSIANENVKRIVNWIKANQLQLAAEKTEVLVITHRRKWECVKVLF